MLARLLAVLLVVAVGGSSANAWLAQGSGAAAPPAGPFVLKCHAGAAASAGIITGLVDCTGANRCYVVQSRYTGGGASSAPTDTSLNTYVQVGTEATTSTSTGVTLWKVSGNATVTNSFQWANSTITFSSMAAACFSDSSTEATDQISQANDSNQPGSITPTVDNELLIAGFVTHDSDSGTPTINSSFTVSDSAAYVGGTNEGGGMAYQIQTTATARNPTWSTTGGNTGASIQASFK